MSVQTSQKTTTTYRTVKVATPEPVTSTVLSASPVTSTVLSASPVSTAPYSLNGYETVRYLVPVQQQQQPSYVLMQQPMMQQVVSPVYLQGMQHLSVSSQDSDLLYQQSASLSGKSSSVFSQLSSPVKSPEPSVEEGEEGEEAVEVEEVEILNVIQQKPSSPLPPPPVIQVSKAETNKLDTRYFGELLADVYRKNCDIHSCISEHVSKIRGKKHQLDPSNDYQVEREEVEALLPKGATELTKQQIRYLLQTRLTADKSMRLLLSTFSSLREELLHMSEHLRRLESEKEALERDLSFKADQARQYDCLLEAVRENNRQLQVSLKETISAQRSLEGQLASRQTSDSGREFQIKELEGRMRALEKENEMLRQKLAGQSSSSSLQIKTDELSRQYREQLSLVRQEKDQEIQRLRSQITTIQMEVSGTQSSTEKSLQLKISELLAMLEKQQTTITRQEEEIRRLTQDKNSSSNVTKTIITKRYVNQYPMLGLLGDEYQTTSPVREAQTVVIERTSEE